MRDISRRDFLVEASLGIAGILGIPGMGVAMKKENERSGVMPVLFVGHGNPMNAIEDTDFSRAWAHEGMLLPRPNAILCISAHWQTNGTLVGTTPRPEMIYDFYGFPDELSSLVYPVRGSPQWAEKVRMTITASPVNTDSKRGLDHGAWVVLHRIFPKADIPVFQMSLDRGKGPREHYEIARQLQPLRENGLLIVSSGNMVHNLALMEWSDSAFSWANEFDRKLTGLIEKRDHNALIDYTALGPSSTKAIPTNEHYIPMLYALALQRKDESLRFFADRVTLGSMSMRSFRIG